MGATSCGGCLRAYASWTLAASINVPSTSRDITGVRGYAAPDNSKARWAKFNRLRRTSGPPAPPTSLTRKLASVFDRLLVPSIVPCPIGKLLTETDPDSATNLRTALALPFRELPNVKIRQAIFDEAKVPTSVETISAHRKGECRCTTP